MKENAGDRKKGFKRNCTYQDISNKYRTNYLVVYYIVNNLERTIGALLKTNTGIEPTAYVQPIIGITIFTVALVVAVYYSFIINSYTLLIEKTKHSLESLLCTPLTIKQFWFGQNHVNVSP